MIRKKKKAKLLINTTTAYYGARFAISPFVEGDQMRARPSLLVVLIYVDLITPQKTQPLDSSACQFCLLVFTKHKLKEYRLLL